LPDIALSGNAATDGFDTYLNVRCADFIHIAVRYATNSFELRITFVRRFAVR
jgi:hypothetical protein